jgi:hypothetical protein
MNHFSRSDRVINPREGDDPMSYKRATPYRRHGKPGCTANHRNWVTKAQCLWPRATWIIGDGPWASVSRCRPGVTTVMLHHTELECRWSIRQIAAGGCGGVCVGRHDFVRIALGEERAA